MSDDRPQENQEPYAAAYERRSNFNVPVIVVIFVFALISFWSFAVISTRVIAEAELLPGNEPNPLGITSIIPGATGPKDKAQAETIDERINILLLGLDQRLDDARDEPYRTDSVIIFTIDPYSKTGGALSIPRDTLVEIPDGNGGIYTSTRINEAYEMGEYTSLSSYPGGGPQLAMDTIEHNFGIPIDYYVILNWSNFINIIDELGGIDVTIPEYAYDPAYSTCSFCGEYYPVEFVPGVEHMDGQRALAYARIRASDNDFKRMERQQIVMRAVARKALSLNLLDVPKARSLYDQYNESVRTNIPAIKVPGLALLGSQVGVDNLRLVSAAPATYACGSPCGGAAILAWDRAKFEELKAQVFSDSALSEEYARVEVLNGTTVPDLAGDFAGYMRSQGVSSDQILVDEYADGLLYDTTIIIDVNGDASYTAGKVAEWLSLPEGSVISGSDGRAAQFLDTTAEVVVVLGADVEMPSSTFAGTQTGG